MKIRFEEVSFAYPSGVKALEAVNLQIESGQCVALIGENGAGKSTLVKHLNGLLRPERGAVWVGDWNAAEHSTAELAVRVGFLFQNPDDQLFERSVSREVAFGPRNLGLSGEELDDRVRKALEQVGMLEESEKHPYDLPYPERKLVALAATLAMQTPILVLDEITVGQDAVQSDRLKELIQELKQESRSLILISHDLDFCADLADRVVVMADGQVLDDGSVERVLANAEVLAQAALHPPQLMRLAQALGMSVNPLGVEDFVVAYTAWREERRAK